MLFFLQLQNSWTHSIEVIVKIKRIKINLYEYLWLGLISVFIGAFLGILGSYIFAHYVFNIGFVVNYLGILEIGVFIVFITLLLGVFNLRRVVTDSPLNVLRAE